MEQNTEFWAIDTHAHFGCMDGFPQKAFEKQLCTLSLEQLESAYQTAGIRTAMASPAEALFPTADCGLELANDRTYELAVRIPWLYQWVVVNPLVQKSYVQAEELLKDGKCVGVKLHPEAHRYLVQDYGDELFAFCSRHRTVLQIHSGEAGSMPEAWVPFADKYPEAVAIAAHLGCGSDGDVTHQVRAIQAARHGNIYTDVSSARSILPNLLEWAVAEVGAEKLLFGTDTPLHHIAMMKERVVRADLTDREKKLILHGNAERLFGAMCKE